METKHIVVNGTYYDSRTPRAVMDALENARLSKKRIRLHYGDIATGRDWLDEWDVSGTVGRSTGPIKIPLIIANARSCGGPGILDHCIVRIRTTVAPFVDLYRHKKYHTGKMEIIDEMAISSLPVAVTVNGEIYARFHNKSGAEKYIKKFAS